MTEETIAPDVAQQLEENWHRVSALFTEVMPVFRNEAPPLSWRPTAMGLLVRGHYAQQSLFALPPERRLDAAVLARVAFEHLVTFAWLLVDPLKHHAQFLRNEVKHTTDLLADLSKQAGREVVNGNEALAELEAAAAKESMPKFDRRSDAADQHWREKFPAHPWQFRFLYATLYRPYSGYVHPLMNGIWPFVHDAGVGTRIGQPAADLVPGHIRSHSAALLSSALVIASSAFGWPSHEAIRQAWTHGLIVTDGVIRLAPKDPE